MKGTAAELHGRLAEAEELERAIDAGQFRSLSDLRTALYERTTQMQSDLLALSALDAMLQPTAVGEAITVFVPRLLH